MDRRPWQPCITILAQHPKPCLFFLVAYSALLLVLMCWCLPGPRTQQSGCEIACSMEVLDRLRHPWRIRSMMIYQWHSIEFCNSREWQLLLPKHLRGYTKTIWSTSSWNHLNIAIIAQPQVVDNMNQAHWPMKSNLNRLGIRQSEIATWLWPNLTCSQT